MSQVIDVKVGRKYAVYLPKRIAEALQIREGDRLILSQKVGRRISEPSFPKISCSELIIP